MWRTYKDAGRPFPVLDDDPVIDYMIVEALSTKAIVDEEKARKKREMDEWKKDKEGLDRLKEASQGG